MKVNRFKGFYCFLMGRILLKNRGKYRQDYGSNFLGYVDRFIPFRQAVMTSSRIWRTSASKRWDAMVTSRWGHPVSGTRLKRQPFEAELAAIRRFDSQPSLNFWANPGSVQGNLSDRHGDPCAGQRAGAPIESGQFIENTSHLARCHQVRVDVPQVDAQYAAGSELSLTRSATRCSVLGSVRFLRSIAVVRSFGFVCFSTR